MPTLQEKFMVDEILESSTAPSSPTPAEEPKKKRAPRRSKEEIAADLAAKQLSKSARKPKTSAAADVAAVQTVQSKGAKTPAAPKAAPALKPVTKPAPASSDDFADLLALEVENQKLRKSLAEKLRAENADLRKKLGLS
jgi:hypothetical protein